MNGHHHDAALASIAGHGLPTGARELPGRPLPEDAWRELLVRARYAKLTGHLMDALAAGDLAATDAQAAEAEELHIHVVANHLMLESTLLRASGLLGGIGIATRVLKGPAVAALDYPDPSPRSFGDIDLLVRPQDLDRAIGALALQGARRRFPEPRPGFDRRFTKSVCVVTREQRELDLHRTLCPGPHGLRLSIEDLWSHPGTPLPLGGTVLTALGPEERLLHACYHAALGDVPPRLVPLRDIAQMLLTGRVDVQHALQTARRWRGEAVVAHAVRHAWRTLRITETVPMSAWAERYRASAAEERALQRAISPTRTYAGQCVATVRAIPGPSDRARYVWALTVPSSSYLDGRHPGPLRRLWHHARPAGASAQPADPAPLRAARG